MNFLNKKILIGIIIIIILVNAIGLGIFYYQKIYIPSDISFETDEETDGYIYGECLREVKTISDDELVDRVNGLEFSAGTDISIIEERLDSIYKDTIDYLICKVKYNKSEENYNRAKSFMESATYTSEENKQSVLNRLDEALDGNLEPTDMLALSPIELICFGDQIKEKFLKFNLERLDPENKLSSAEIEKRLNETKKLCGVINKYKTDPPFFIESIVNSSWSNNELILERQMQARVGVAFRLGGEELAFEICNILPDAEMELKSDCQGYVNYLSSLISLECYYNKQKIIDVICAIN